MNTQENLGSKTNISNKKYCQKEIDSQVLHHKSLTHTYDYLV